MEKETCVLCGRSFEFSDEHVLDLADEATICIVDSAERPACARCCRVAIAELEDMRRRGVV